MTREEAIEVLKHTTWKAQNEKKADEILQAFEMAIQALSQEPTEKPMTVDEMEREYEKSKALFHKIVECEDAISREAVKNMLWKAIEDLEDLPSLTNGGESR